MSKYVDLQARFNILKSQGPCCEDSIVNRFFVASPLPVIEPFFRVTLMSSDQFARKSAFLARVITSHSVAEQDMWELLLATGFLILSSSTFCSRIVNCFPYPRDKAARAMKLSRVSLASRNCFHFIMEANDLSSLIALVARSKLLSE